MSECAFCAEFRMPVETTWIVAHNDDWVVLPTIGCFVEGYSLYMPVDHILSFADLGSLELASVEGDVEVIRSRLTQLYGPTIVAEHGPRDCDLGASCCDHAHLHLIPVADPKEVLHAYGVAGGPTREATTIADCMVSVDSSYVYLSPWPGRHLLWPAAGFPRQWARRVCSALHGMKDLYDWRSHPFTEKREHTYETLSKAFSSLRLRG